MLTTMAALAEPRGVAAFNAIQLEHVEAIALGAERAGAGAVVQISENAVRYHGALAPLAAAARAVAEASTAPLVLHLDHATDEGLVREAVDLGFGSVMYDASHLDHAANLRRTAGVVERCHAHGVWVEAELGEIGGKDGAHAPGVRTDPTEAAAFVAATGVDALAVAVGSSHAMLERSAQLDLDLIAALHQALPTPLVLHGSSGVSDADLARAVAAGMTKINIGTQLNKVLTATLRAELAAHPELVDARRYLGPARGAVAAEVARLIHVLG